MSLQREVAVDAATAIQSLFRGHIARQSSPTRFDELRRDDSSKDDEESLIEDEESSPPPPRPATPEDEGTRDLSEQEEFFAIEKEEPRQDRPIRFVSRSPSPSRRPRAVSPERPAWSPAWAPPRHPVEPLPAVTRRSPSPTTVSTTPQSPVDRSPSRPASHSLQSRMTVTKVGSHVGVGCSGLPAGGGWFHNPIGDSVRQTISRSALKPQPPAAALSIVRRHLFKDMDKPPPPVIKQVVPPPQPAPITPEPSPPRLLAMTNHRRKVAEEHRRIVSHTTDLDRARKEVYSRRQAHFADLLAEQRRKEAAEWNHALAESRRAAEEARKVPRALSRNEAAKARQSVQEARRLRHERRAAESNGLRNKAQRERDLEREAAAIDRRRATIEDQRRRLAALDNRVAVRAAITLQRAVRAWRARRTVERRQWAATTLACAWRRLVARRLRREEALQLWASVRLQTAIRSWLACRAAERALGWEREQRRRQRRRSSTTSVASAAPARVPEPRALTPKVDPPPWWLARWRREYRARRMAAAIMAQTAARGWLARRHFTRLQQQAQCLLPARRTIAAFKATRAVRRWLVQRHKEACDLMRHAIRRWLARRWRRRIICSAVRAQARVRGWLTRLRVVKLRERVALCRRLRTNEAIVHEALTALVFAYGPAAFPYLAGGRHAVGPTAARKDVEGLFERAEELLRLHRDVMSVIRHAWEIQNVPPSPRSGDADSDYDWLDGRYEGNPSEDDDEDYRSRPLTPFTEVGAIFRVAVRAIASWVAYVGHHRAAMGALERLHRRSPHLEDALRSAGGRVGAGSGGLAVAAGTPLNWLKQITSTAIALSAATPTDHPDVAPLQRAAARLSAAFDGVLSAGVFLEASSMAALSTLSTRMGPDEPSIPLFGRRLLLAAQISVGFVEDETRRSMKAILTSDSLFLIVCDGHDESDAWDHPSSGSRRHSQSSQRFIWTALTLLTMRADLADDTIRIMSPRGSFSFWSDDESVPAAVWLLKIREAIRQSIASDSLTRKRNAAARLAAERTRRGGASISAVVAAATATTGSVCLPSTVQSRDAGDAEAWDATDTPAVLQLLPMGDGRAMLLAATPDKLIEIATHAFEPASDAFFDCLLLTFRVWSTPPSFLSLILHRWRNLSGGALSSRRRTLLLLYRWMRSRPADFGSRPGLAPSLLKEIRTFLNDELADVESELHSTVDALRRAQSSLSSRVRRSMMGGHSSRGGLVASPALAPDVDTVMASGFGLSATLGSSGVQRRVAPVAAATETVDILNRLSTFSVACALTSSEWKAFSAVRLDEGPIERSALEALSEGCRSAALWVASAIVVPERRAERLFSIRRFIQVADACRQMNNLHTVSCIVQGFETAGWSSQDGSDVVHKWMSDVWVDVPQAELSVLQKLAREVSPSRSFAAARQAMVEIPLPALPPVRMLLDRLLPAFDASTDTDALVPWAALADLSSAIEEMILYQTIPLQPVADAVALRALKRARWLTAGELGVLAHQRMSKTMQGLRK